MIESVLALARDDAKRESRSLVDLSALVEGICEDASDAGEPVTFSGPRGVTISCRPTALRRAISNLVDNAVKYGGNAAVSLSPETDRIFITLDDEGPGIPPSEREKVFEPFYRIDSSRDPDTGGVGLGLSVARSTVWEHGGEITLASRKGGGVCWTGLWTWETGAALRSRQVRFSRMSGFKSYRLSSLAVRPLFASLNL
jgi:signal transduction histidine kinase